MYNRFDTGIQPREYFNDIAQTTKQHINILENILKNVIIFYVKKKII